MIRHVKSIAVCIPAFYLMLAPAQAHTPLCSCYDNGESILCEGGFSDGSSASGTGMKVLDASGKVITEGKMNNLSEFEFAKPEGEFKVIFEGGEGHSIEINSSDIAQ